MTIDPARPTAAAAGVAAAIAAAACNGVPYCIGDCVDATADTAGDTVADGEEADSGLDVEADTAADSLDAPDVEGDVIDEDGPATCEPACTGTTVCCDGASGPACVDLDVNPSNCGECGNQCRLPNAYNQCVDGECSVASCDVNFFDC